MGRIGITAGVLMRSRFIALDPGQSLHEAWSLMRLGRLREVPVVHEGWLVGRVLYADVAGPGSAQADGGDVAHAMREALYVEPQASARSVALTLLEAGSAAVAVVEASPRGCRILGIVTERELLRLAYEGRPAFAPRAK